MSLLDNIKKIPAHWLFYLLVDGLLIDKEQGWQAYESREPGCVKDFFNALTYVTQDLDEKKVTVTFLQTLHALASPSAMKDSFGRPGEFYYDNMGGIFQGKDHYIQLPKTNVTAQGILQFLAFQDKYNHLYTHSIKSKNVSLSFETVEQLARDANCSREGYVKRFLAEAGETITIQLITPNDMEVRVRGLISELNEKLNIDVVEDKERVIVEYIQLLEQLHPFYDVNNRTFINLLLLRLSLQHDLSPALLMDYNIFDGHSVDEILVKLKEGRDAFAQLIKGNPVFNYDPDSMLAGDKLKLVGFTHMFIHGPSPELQQYIYHLEGQHEKKACLRAFLTKSQEENRCFMEAINSKELAVQELCFRKLKPICEPNQTKVDILDGLDKLILETSDEEKKCYEYIRAQFEKEKVVEHILFLFSDYVEQKMPIKGEDLSIEMGELVSGLVYQLEACDFLKCRELLDAYPMESALNDLCKEDGLDTEFFKKQLFEFYIDMKTKVEALEWRLERRSSAPSRRLGFFASLPEIEDAFLSDSKVRSSNSLI